MARIRRVDMNQREIVLALRNHGASVQCIHDLGKGCPDLLVGFRGKNFLLELKTDSKKDLTPDEKEWHSKWAGSVCRVDSTEEALILIGASFKKMNL